MRRKRTVIITLSIFVVLAAILVPFVMVSRPSPDKIAVIPLTGFITSGASSSLSGSTITPGLVRYYFRRAKADSAVKAIVLVVESSGGEIAASQEILWEIEKIRERMPVVVSMGRIAASGGYYISSKADKIVALPTTLTGGIGVISQVVNIEGLLAKLGIEVETFKGGRYKDMYRGLRKMTPEERQIMQRMTDEYYEHFIDVVAEGRGLARDEVRNLATGQLYTGAAAKQLGLVDELGGLDTAIDLALELAGIEAAITEYYRPPRLTLWSLLGLADAIKTRILGLSAQDIILLEILRHNYRQPLFLYQS